MDEAEDFHDHGERQAGSVWIVTGPHHMIIERITSIRVIPPRDIVRQVPVGRISHTGETTRIVDAGQRQIPDGASGALLDVCYEDIDVGVYSSRDQILFAQQTQIGPR